MHSLHRRTYRLLLRLHPAAFRDEFAREMELDFEEALHTYGPTRLFLDAVGSLARQWSTSISFAPPNPVSPPRSSLLAGYYVTVRDSAFTPVELGLGLIASTSQLTLCLFALSAGSGHIPDLPTVYASSNAPSPMRDNTDPETPLPTDRSSSSEFKPSQNATANLGFAIARLAEIAQPKPELLLFHPSGPLPSYEVATIKPRDPDAASNLVKLPPGGFLSPLSIRRYIMNAYGAVYAPQIVGGPDWLNKDAYLINGKIPDDLQSALQKMTREGRNDQTRMMEQSLLADRFHLKAHFETRVLPVYALVAGNSGLKMTEVPVPPESKPGDPPMRPHPGDPLPPGTLVTIPNSNGLRILNGRAIKMQLLARVIGTDIGDRPIVDHTGFNGYFNVTDLTWAPLASAGATNDSDALSLTGALKEKLGLKIVPTKVPIEILIIDGIDRPTPN
ncbi:TIGR03435 family protein [Granulicella sp. dw_53]|uniref:TIGR03435 family protein n=1 Tax=Granulicella sp. dw_53 TaxID=2719792 RepID=UPI001BD36FEE|nr:TIGR03435 family protein [Granulicella sp. dw_53]